MFAFASVLDETFLENDAEILRVIPWRKSAPKSLVESAQKGDITAFSKKLIKHLKEQTSHQKSAKKNQKLQLWRELQWSSQAFSSPLDKAACPVYAAALELLELQYRVLPAKKMASGKSKLEQLIKKLHKAIKKATDFGTASPIDLLASLHLLTVNLDQFDHKTAFSLWKFALLQTVELSEQLMSGTGCTAPADQMLIVFGELPWHAGLLFSEIQGMKSLMKTGQKYLKEGLESQSDTDGTPNAEIVSRLSLWIAPLVRSVCVAKRYDEKLWTKKESTLFNNILRKAVSLCHSDGRIAMSNGVAVAPVSLLSAGAQCNEWSSNDPINAYVNAMTIHENAQQSTSKKTISKRSYSFEEENPPGMQSDWAKLACLRNNWLPASDACVITHNEGAPALDLSAFGESLCSGEWEIEVWQNESRVVPEKDAEWVCACWQSDEDGDYMEIQLQMTKTVKVSRYLFLSRNDHFLMAGDCVEGAAGASLSWQSKIPLAKHVKIKIDQTTREVALKGSKLKSRFFPMAFEQDRVNRAVGNMEFDDANRLVLTYAPKGSAFFAPVFFDWSPNRQKKAADWRSLTVSEDGRRVPSAESSGHRLRIGSSQWLLYHRILNNEEPQSVLGLHTLYETVLGEFSSQGHVTPLIEVEAGE